MSAQDQLIDTLRADYKARAEANAEPLPGPLANAIPGHVDVAGIRIRPVVHYDFVILKNLDSPIYRQILELSKPEQERQPVQFTDEDSYLIAYQLMIPVAQARDESSRGHEHYLACALRATAYALPPGLMATVIQTVMEQYKRAFETALAYGAPQKDGEVFQQPPTAQKTVSVGGSNTFADLSGTLD